MFKLLIRWAILAVSIWAALNWVPGLHPTAGGWWFLLVLAFIFGLVNALVRPLLELLALPFIILTLGLGSLLVNTFLFWLAGYIGQNFGFGFTADGFWPLFFGALCVSIINAVLSFIFQTDAKERRPAKPKSSK